MLQISSAFDSGNIIIHQADTPGNIRLSIAKDRESDFFQWFHFRLSGAKDEACQFTIENADQAAFKGGWKDYKVCVSYDRETWFRVQTSYVDGELSWQHTPEFDSVYYAYFAPYSLERHADFVADCLQHDEVSLRVLGQTIKGRDMDCLSIGTGEKVMWVIGRQHPGETQASWWMEGFLSRLLDDNDPVARVLREKGRFHIVSNMNPDGSFEGHLRTNYAGANLNREWNKASLQSSPEVYHTLAAMDDNPPDMCLDVHGDESLPYNFIAGAEGIPGYTDKQAQNLADFLMAYKIASPDFQTEIGYPKTKAGKANMSYCTNYTARTYDCLAMTLEMPFKDNANMPDPKYGWSPERCANLGAASLDAMLAVIDKL